MASSPALFASRHSGTRPSRLHSRSESGGTVRMRPVPSSGPGAERTASRRLTIRARRSPPMPAVVMVPTRRASSTHGPDSMDNGIRNSPGRNRSRARAAGPRLGMEQNIQAALRSQAARQQPALAGR